jgi:hypothetical protein
MIKAHLLDHFLDFWPQLITCAIIITKNDQISPFGPFVPLWFLIILQNIMSKNDHISPIH